MGGYSDTDGIVDLECNFDENGVSSLHDTNPVEDEHVDIDSTDNQEGDFGDMSRSIEFSVGNGISAGMGEQMYLPKAIAPACMVEQAPEPDIELTELPMNEHNGVVPNRDALEHIKWESGHSHVARTEEDRLLAPMGRHEFDIEPYAVDANGIPIYRYVPYLSQVEGEFIAPIKMPLSGWKYIKFPAGEGERSELARSLNGQYMAELQEHGERLDAMRNIDRMLIEERRRLVDIQREEFEHEQKIKNDENYMHQLNIAHIRDMTIDQMHKVDEIGGLSRESGDVFSKQRADGKIDFYKIDVNGNAYKQDVLGGWSPLQ